MAVHSPWHDEALQQRLRHNLASFSRRAIAPGERRVAAVAMVVCPDEQGRASFVLTRRASRLRAHAGQWALPGGRRDGNEDAATTAIRETGEEVGVELGIQHEVGQLDDFATRSGYVITPVVFWCDWVLQPRPNAEVSAVFQIPVHELSARPRFEATHTSEQPLIKVHLPTARTFIHAPTAALLHQLWEVAFEGRETRVAHYEQPGFAWK